MVAERGCRRADSVHQLNPRAEDRLSHSTSRRTNVPPRSCLQHFQIDDIPGPQAQEAYELRIQTFATLRAKNYAGVQRGLQTLKQILENATQFGSLPHC